ncbi:Hypothetical predicted protein [Paramuricea clavata]|uniref:Uncharacterized protein n=1 Tax=Paramuricea clavata TaxID=317549 RepID=A0A6S7FQP1_PARCT|nr:Hypothetical predicted protein [Paramuricea clavata]
MAKRHKENQSYFGPIALPNKLPEFFDEKENKDYEQPIKEEKRQVFRGHKRVLEKVKQIRQSRFKSLFMVHLISLGIDTRVFFLKNLLKNTDYLSNVLSSIKSAIPCFNKLLIMHDDEIRIAYKDVHSGCFINIHANVDEQFHLTDTFNNVVAVGAYDRITGNDPRLWDQYYAGRPKRCGKCNNDNGPAAKRCRICKETIAADIDHNKDSEEDARILNMGKTNPTKQFNLLKKRVRRKVQLR